MAGVEVHTIVWAWHTVHCVGVWVWHTVHCVGVVYCTLRGRLGVAYCTLCGRVGVAYCTLCGHNKYDLCIWNIAGFCHMIKSMYIHTYVCTVHMYVYLRMYTIVCIFLCTYTTLSDCPPNIEPWSSLWG